MDKKRISFKKRLYGKLAYFLNKFESNSYKRKRKTMIYDGIKFEAFSEEELRSLVNLYMTAKSEAPDQSFFDKVKTTGVKISCCPRSHAYVSDDAIDFVDRKTSYNGSSNSLFIDISYIGEGTTASLIHELGHCLDYNNGKNQLGFEGCKKAVKNFLPKAFDEERDFVLETLTSPIFMTYYNNFQIKYMKYIKAIDERLNSPEEKEKITNMAKEMFTKSFSSTDYNSETFIEYKKQLYYRIKDSMVKMSGYSAISDIYDALSMGELKSSLLSRGNKINYVKENGAYGLKGIKGEYFGHSIEYYKDPLKRTKEIVANVSLLMNKGQKNLLYEFFPEEVANGFIETYNSLIEYKRQSFEEPREKMAM